MSDTLIEIPEALFAPAQSASFSGQLEPLTIDAGPDTYTFADPLTWDITISNTGDAFLVDGTVSGVGTTQCARCLEDTQVDIEGHIEAYYVLPDAEDPEDMDDDEFDRLPESKTIDIVPHIIAAILVDVPLVPLCREDCKGICPDCGANLNKETCDCAAKRAEQDAADEEAANPFSVLKDYEFEDR